MRFFYVFLLVVLCVATPNRAFPNDLVISAVEQSSRDSEKEKILLREQASEVALLEQRQFDLAVAEAAGDTSTVERLKAAIAQHITNLELLKNELHAIGEGKHQRTTRGKGATDQAAKTPEWWDPYSRNTEISTH